MMGALVVYNGAIGRSRTRWRWLLTEVRVGKDETLDSALRRFKRQVKRSGILTDAKRHEHYEKPSQKRRRRAARRKRH
jgi:small subunit ribosomal protein S21